MSEENVEVGKLVAAAVNLRDVEAVVRQADPSIECRST